MKTKIAGIYKITNKLDNKIYIGQSIDLHKRMGQYHHKCTYLYNALKMHGKENFESSIVEECLMVELDEREIYWIKELHSHVSEGGYNISWGGDAPSKGKKLTQETKDKLSKSLTGIKRSDETKQKMSNAQKGRIISDEQRERLLKMIRTGIPHTKESKLKMSESRSGEKHHGFGKSLSEETKKRISEAQKGDKNHSFGKRGIKSKNASSQYYGVSYSYRVKDDINSGYWRVAIRLSNGKIIGRQCKTEIDAAEKADKIIIEYNLDRNLLNFPENYTL